MADAPPAPARKTGVKSEFLGQPVWFWATGAGIIGVIGVYIWWKHHQAGTAASQAAPASGSAVPYSSFQAWLLQNQSSPKTKPAFQWFTPTKSGTAGDLIADERWSKTVGGEFLSLNGFTDSTQVPAGTPVKFPANATP